MTPKQLIFILFVLIVKVVSSQEETTQAIEGFWCEKIPVENEYINDCACYSNKHPLILQDNLIEYGNESIELANSTIQWMLHDCSEVHLSGPTLLSIKNLQKIELRNIGELHIDNDFFSHFNSNLQELQIKNSRFASHEGSLKIESQRFKNIVLDGLDLEDTFSVLIHTEENHTLDLMAIKNCKIDNLGEINLSSRQVNQFLLENNTINNIMPSAILHTSNTTTIVGNTLMNMSLLSTDITTWSFMLRNNTINVLRYTGLCVNNASFIQISGNNFSMVEQYSFIYMKLISINSSFTLALNHFYQYEPGSLQFDHTIYNENLLISLNAIHTKTCDSTALDILEDMTQAHNTTKPDFNRQRFMTWEMLKETTACIDKTRDVRSMMVVGEKPDPQTSWIPTLIGVMALIPIVGIALLFVVKRQNCAKLMPRKSSGNDYAMNFAYEDDSEDEQYVRS